MDFPLPGKYFKPLICLLSGAILPLAFAPFELSFIPYISIPVLLYCWIGSMPGSAFLYGYLFGLGLFGVGVNWLHISINLFGGVNFVGAVFFTYLLVAFISLYPALTGYIARKYFNRHESLQLLIVFPGLWVFMEWCRSWILTGFPWLNLGYSQIDTPLENMAPLVGVYGISVMVMVSSAIIVYALSRPIKKSFLFMVVILMAWSGLFILTPINWSSKKNDVLNIALVQGGIPQEEKWKPENRLYTRELYLKLSEPYWHADMIIWPETAIPSFLHFADDFILPINKLVGQNNAVLITGIPIKDTSDHRYYNSIIIPGYPDQRYDKHHLVPFGEYLPFNKWLRPVFSFLGIPVSDFSSGQTLKPILSVAGQQVGVSICYEDAFGEEVIKALPEANLLINISNDAWFGDSFAPHQHLQMARMRALETNRYMLRATNTGISAIINQKGKIISRSRQFEPDVISDEVFLYSGITPYAKFGNWIIILPVSLILLLIYFRDKKSAMK